MADEKNWRVCVIAGESTSTKFDRRLAEEVAVYCGPEILLEVIPAPPVVPDKLPPKIQKWLGASGGLLNFLDLSEAAEKIFSREFEEQNSPTKHLLIVDDVALGVNPTKGFSQLPLAVQSVWKGIFWQTQAAPALVVLVIDDDVVAERTALLELGIDRIVPRSEWLNSERLSRLIADLEQEAVVRRRVVNAYVKDRNAGIRWAVFKIIVLPVFLAIVAGFFSGLAETYTKSKLEGKANPMATPTK